MQLICRQQVIDFPRRPLLMGIVNINDDSLSGDGSLSLDAALDQAAGLVANGADMIDVGGESARTNREPITTAQEISRVAPFIEQFAAYLQSSGCQPLDETQVFPPLLSLNTWRTEVISELLPLGVDLLNDMSALPTPDNAGLAARHAAALLVMHSVGTPKVDHSMVRYTDILQSIHEFFADRLTVCRNAGLSDESLILDPGIDFAKQSEDNLAILGQLEVLTDFQRPILLPVSRKGLIGDILDIPNPADRDAGTQALIEHGMMHGASIFRVHNVQAAYQTVKLLYALKSD